MKLYKKAELSQDDRGFFRYLGGRRFRLGQNQERAKIAAVRLESLFSRCGEWDGMTLQLATAIIRGEHQATLPPNPEMNGAESYVHWVDRFAVLYGDIIRILPENPALYEEGQAAILADRQGQFEKTNIAYPLTPSIARDLPHERLHKAIDDYCDHLGQRTDSSGWLKVKAAQARRLKVHKDIPLSQMTLDVMDEMLSYWANRPRVKDRDKAISVLTARNQIKELKDFWKWLHRSEKYAWKRPDGWDELKPKIVKLQSDRQALHQAAHVPTFTVKELTDLYRNATPLVRAFILLGLNCGFSIAEVATLMTDEIRLHQPHPHGNRLRLNTSAADSWIMRVRHKSGVYGEFKLWPQTVLALEWATQRMKSITPKGKILFVSDRGNPLNTPTSTGNKSSRIPNLWNNLYRTAQAEQAQKEDGELRRLAFKYLRKTAGDMIRQVSDGEIAGVFLCHGQPVKTDALADVYTNRPFGKVFAAIEKVAEQLQPMFDAVQEPFPS